MSNVAAGTLWNLPNLDGVLFTPSLVNTPFVNRIAQARIVQNDEFAMSSHYDHEAAAQPAITETASLTAPTALSMVRSNEKNVVQIFHQKVSLSYSKLSAKNRLQYAESGSSGYSYSSADGQNAAADELLFQQKAHMEKLRRDMEYTWLNGAYQIATSAGVANKTRGIITGSTVNTTDAASGKFTKKLLLGLLKKMHDNGAQLDVGRFAMFLNSVQLEPVESEFVFAPMDRNIAGSALNTIITKFCNLEVVLNPFVPAGTILIADMSKVSQVFQPVPNKPTAEQMILWEQLSKTGAGEDWQLYLQAGLDYGSAYFHGTLTSLATA